MEQRNDDRLHDLAGKLASIRQVTNDIYTQASDHSIIDSATETFGSMLGSVRSSGARLVRAARAGHPVFKTVGMALAIILLIYMLFNYFS